MLKTRLGPLSGFTILAALLCIAGNALQVSPVLAEDMCIRCHTDEEMLTQNLSGEEKKKSALQSGPG